MSQLKSLTFCVVPADGSGNPVIQKRLKLIERLETQRRLAVDPSLTVAAKRTVRNPDGTRTVAERQKRVRPWWRTEERGAVVMTVRLGLKALEFEKGKSGVAVGSMDRLDGVIGTIIEAVRAGELDHHLMKGNDERPLTPLDARRGRLRVPVVGSLSEG